MESLKRHTNKPCPREKANFLSYWIFWWVLPIFFKGRKRELLLDDLYEPLKAHKSDFLGSKLCRAWENELADKKNVKDHKPSLMRAGLSVFGWEIWFLGIVLLAMEMCLKVTQPIFLGELINYYSSAGGDINEAYLYAGAVILCTALNVLFMHPYMLSILHCGMKLRVAACSLIYRKTLRLSKTSLGDTTAGQIVNLLSNDVGRLDLSVIFVHYLWVGPLETIVVTYLMWREIGISAVFGTIFLLCFIPLQIFLGKKTSVWRLKTAIRTDERVRLMNEIIQGIQVIKMYAWEKPFAALVEMARRKEVRVIRYVSYIRGIILSFIMFTTRVSVFISLVAFALLGNVVTAKQAFMITAYYNILRPTMTIFFPQGIGQLAETIVSVRRIEKYMLYDEIKNRNLGAMSENVADDKKTESKSHSEMNELTVSGSEQSTITKNLPEKEIFDSSNEERPVPVNGSTQHLSETGVMVQHLKAKWVPDIPEYTLNDVNLHVQPGTLVAVIGPVGSGKTSLLQAILGELSPESGSIAVNGVVSYASQEPWLFSATVRQNILFGLPMERDRYRQVVKKCALERDFQLFSHGDKTIVGERGVSLSGGQKARISLARAVYRRAAVYLLDDPLSAVDSHVGKHLFDKCMRDYLRGKIVILVTHQLQYLQHADQIVILDHGRVKAVGTYDSLRETGLDFAKLLAEPSDDEAGSRSGSVRRNSSTRLNRQNSESSVHSAEDTCVDETNVTQMNEEKRQVGKIGLEMYTSYFKAGGGLFTFIILLSFFIVAQFLASAGDFFLSYWVKKEGARSPVLNATQFELEPNATDSVAAVFGRHTRDTKSGFDEFIESVRTFIDDLVADENFDVYVFSFITVATVLVTLWRSFMFFNVAMRASKSLHNKMFLGITHASMYFFNTNPSGRILNRFSKDMGQIDEILPSIMIDVIQIFLSLLGIVVVVGIVNPYFLIPTVLVGILFYFMRTFYLLTSRSIKRMEATTRSPIYSHLAATLNGLSTIRAFGAERILVKEFDGHQDLHSGAFYLFIATSRAFGFYLDVCSVLYIAVITMSFFLFPTDGGNVGLAITQALGLTGMVQWGMRQSAELENTMTAVERVVEYESVDPEGALESTDEHKPPKSWPAEGRIKFDKVSLRYAPEPESGNVLRELEFEIQPTEKIGIVGRTGAGKSSIINALFRLSYTEGPIIIDMRDTKSMGLHDLRSKISIIPQEPVLFSGTLRYNLDPFEEYADEKLWRALSDVKLREMVKELPQGLASKISEGGSNFSVGQRQLVCLARAILRENIILVMDEATANVDPQTDALIQTTIREKFANCTVLTIAHRLHTVMDSDKVLVMNAGQCVEFGTPHELLQAQEGPKIFYDMVKQTGKGTFEQLSKTAEEAFSKKKKQ